MKKIFLIIILNTLFLYGCTDKDNHMNPHQSSDVKIAKVYDNDNIYLTQIALMRGHLYVGVELYKNGFLDNAKMHMKHPKSELYSDIIPTFKAKGSSGFSKELEELALAVEEEKDFNLISLKYKNLTDAITINESYINESSKSLNEKIVLVVSLLEIAAEEYAIGIVNNNVENKFEYQDALGFTVIAKDILTKSGTKNKDEEIKKNKTLVVLDSLFQLWPSLIPTGKVEGDSKIILNAIAEINSI
tara:strand:- start:1682 stop:2416 length:735 start_codon:yes stop_codon:yes gene_type:complete